MENQIKAGAALNYVIIGINALVGLLYTPYMLRMLIHRKVSDGKQND